MNKWRLLLETSGAFFVALLLYLLSLPMWLVAVPLAFGVIFGIWLNFKYINDYNNRPSWYINNLNDKDSK
jgi:hypothetical protein